MVYDYRGNHNFEALSITLFAPANIGVYYCGILINNQLVPHYVGRAVGKDVTISKRLHEHLSVDKWPDVTHFGFCICDTPDEAIALERLEIANRNPKYNKVGRT